MRCVLPVLVAGACATPRAPAVPTSPPAPRAAATASDAPHAHTFLVDPVEGLALFRDEQRAAEEALASWARSRGLRVVPVEQVERVLARTRAGQRVELQLDGNLGPGEACGRPLADWQALNLETGLFGADGSLRADVTCDPHTSQCTLEVEARDPDGSARLDEVGAYDAHLPWAQELPRALAALHPKPGDRGGLGGLLGSLASGPVEAHPEVLRVDASAALASDTRVPAAFDHAIAFADGTSSLRACFHGEDGTAEVLVAADPAGRIVRCESRDADDPEALCACRDLAAHARTTSALRDTRAFITVQFQAADVATPWHGVVTVSTRTYLDSYRGRDGETLWRPRVSDPSIADWRAPPDSAIARCFGDLPGRGVVSALVTVRFDAKGSVASVSVRPDAHGMTSGQLGCVMRAFAAVRAPCPARDATTAQARIHVVARKIGEPLGSPF